MHVERFSFPVAWRAVLALAAAIVLLRESFAPSSPLLPSGEPDRAGSEQRSPVALLRPLIAVYPAIAAHPLFDPSRQAWTAPASLPPAQQPPSINPAPLPPRGYVLVGLVTGLHQHTALLRDSFGKAIFLTEGQLLTGWTVRHIDAQGVHFQADGNHFDLAIPLAKDTAFNRR